MSDFSLDQVKIERGVFVQPYNETCAFNDLQTCLRENIPMEHCKLCLLGQLCKRGD